MRQAKDKKILVIAGATSTGKSDVAVRLAKKFNGEVVSADSRQVYKGMDIGTGKVTRLEMSGVRHHLLDVVSPKKIFTVADYKRMANEAIEKILSRGRLPILCGGTGLYIRAVVDDMSVPEVPPNIRLRRVLEKKTVDELFSKLRVLDPRRAKEIDRKNPARLIRAIEIASTLGHVPPYRAEGRAGYDFLQIGLTLDMVSLEKKIRIRLLKRLRRGMIAEVKRLKGTGVSWRRLHDFGLEYRFVSAYLRGEMTRGDMVEKLNTAIRQYAKRQVTWFKKDKRIHWFDPADERGVDKLVREW